MKYIVLAFLFFLVGQAMASAQDPHVVHTSDEQLLALAANTALVPAVEAGLNALSPQMQVRRCPTLPAYYPYPGNCGK